MSAIVALGAAAGCGVGVDSLAGPLAFGSDPAPSDSRSPRPEVIRGLETTATVTDTGFLLHTDGGSIDFVAGINVGSALPGRFPAELKVDDLTWRRWLPMMAATGVHALRIYTVQPPAFYTELERYNLEHPDQPLYLVHGIWVGEELLAETGDLFHPSVLAQATTDIDDAVKVVHGEANLPPRPGYASGVYTADVSPWLLSWAFGIEMDPVLVQATDESNADANYQGSWVSPLDDASASEVWLARMLDRIADNEAEYGRSVPLTFVNWPSTDPLRHPYEPSEFEDLVGLDMNHMSALPQWPGGIYASYHAYPYYPDFQRFDPALTTYQYRGKGDPYAGYLAALRDHHRKAGLPVVILEFGLPTSLGSAHNGPLGRDQGGHDEADALALVGDMLRMQRELELAGGFIFSWHDEWFKATWNTADLERPAQRRQLWSNPLTNESAFGLVAMDPARGGVPPVIDGSGDDWDPTRSQVIHESRNAIREVRATHNEGYLYLRVILDQDEVWQADPVVLTFDLIEGGADSVPWVGEGNERRVSLLPDGHRPDYAVVVGPGTQANAYVSRTADINLRFWAPALNLDLVAGGSSDLSGQWVPQRLLINRPLTVPITNESWPAQWFELNPMITGSSDPGAKDFDSRTTWAARDRVIELRLPWAMLGFSDPSSLQALTVTDEGQLATVAVEQLGIAITSGNEVTLTNGYRWEQWNSVEWNERPKKGWDSIVAAIDEVKQP